MPAAMAAQKQTYAARAALAATPPLADYLFRLMDLKQSNICLAADDHDGITTAELVTITEECGDAIVVLKLHSDAIWDLSRETVDALTEISIRKRFLLFDDRLFGNHSPSIVAQYAATPLHPGAWTSLTSAHILHGDGVVKCLRGAAVSLLSRSHAEERNSIGPGDMPRSSSDYFGRQSLSRRHSHSAEKAMRAKAQETRSPGSHGDPNDADDDDRSPTNERHTHTSLHARPPSTTSANIPRNISFAGTSQSRHHMPSPSITSVRSDPFDRRKSSVVSISTTISSSTEYIGSPPAQPHGHAQSSSRYAKPSISTTASSPGLTPDTDTSDAASTTADATADIPTDCNDFDTGPPQSRGILLNTDLDMSAFVAPGASTIGDTAAANGPEGYSYSYKRSCVRVARVNRDFVLGFVSDGSKGCAAALSQGRQDAGESLVNFVGGCCLPGDEGSGSLEAERQRTRRKGGLGGDGYSDASSSENEMPDDDDDDDEASNDSDDSDDHARYPHLPKGRTTTTTASAPQSTVTPAALVAMHGADVLIVGAPVMRALSRREAIERYRRAGWAAYVDSLRSTTVDGAARTR